MMATPLELGHLPGPRRRLYETPSNGSAQEPERSYARSMPREFRMGDVVRLRKPHPCGGFEWRVTRLGADIGLRCLECSRRLMLTRRTLERRLKTFVSRGEPIDQEKLAAIYPEEDPADR